MRLIYRVVWLVVNAAGATYFRWRVYHAERVPRTGPAILAANHASYMDPPLVGGTLPRDIHYLARDTLFLHPPLKQLLPRWNVVPVDREGGGGPGLKAILDRLRGGAAIILFPEGTRTHDGRLQPARAGIGLVILKSACPVVPVRLFGTWEAWGRHQGLPQPRRVTVKFGPPMAFAEARAEARTCAKPRLKALYQAVADELMNAIARLEPCEDVTTFPARAADR
jgi:1-acyl-sn-glycerol-3-phosphate acyltransferase